MTTIAVFEIGILNQVRPILLLVTQYASTNLSAPDPYFISIRRLSM